DGLSVAARGAELMEQMSSRASARSAHVDNALAALPAVVVVLDGARELRSVVGVPELLRSGPGLGIHFICLDASVSDLPVETVSQIEVHASTEPRATLTTRQGVVGGPAGIVPDLPTGGWLERLASSLCPLQDATPRCGDAGLPEQLGLRELAAQEGADPTVATDVVRAWAAGNGPPRALVGVTREGPYWLDLADHGPHALVGGTTGSGKSEMLQTLVAGLAGSSRPDDLGFVLIDYKGGSAFKECARLPHVVGLVTDLDESLTSRALTSLGAELKRRERVLAGSGAKDLDDHRRRRLTDPSLPRLGRLVIVVDEFKMLADELPDFVAGLVQLAAIGRSLGVHLVLATQRPGGIVSADMRANVSLRVALRVRDRSDSDDVIEDPRAATISDRMPGRAFVRTADQRLLEVQFAHVGAPLARERQADTETRVWPLRWSNLAEPPPRAPGRGAGERTELAAIVDAARAAAAALSIDATSAPWLPPLPDVLPTSVLPRAERGVPIGLRDEPEQQSQPVLTWHPEADGHLGIAGGSRTGRSTALRSLVVGLIERHSPADLHVHVLEGRRGALADLLALPHVGSVTSADDPALARRVVSRIAAASRASADGDRRPAHTVLVIDGWEAMEDAFSDVDHGEPTDELLRLARDGLSAGLRLLVAGGRAVSTGRISGLLQRRIVLNMPDPLDLTLAGVDARRGGPSLPPGRGYELPGGHLVHLAHIGASVEEASQIAAVASAADVARLRSHDLPLCSLPWQVRALPAIVTPTELQPDGRSLSLGLGGDAATTVHLDPATSGRRLLVAGPARSGRSTTLALIAQQLVAAGRPVAVVTGRRSRLLELAGLPGLHLLAAADTDTFVELRRATPELGILVDDAENLCSTPMEAALLEATTLVDGAEGVVVVTAETQRALGLFRGLVPEVSRDGCGIMLSPTSAADGDLLRVRLDVPTQRRPGFGFVVADGSCTSVQVADAFTSHALAGYRRFPTINRS
ncbi:MAG: FtsK/SpoIIIE domain-containing protein, partial [Terracoccus sp.]